MSTQWMDDDERGSPVLIRLIAWITLHLGYPVGRLLLAPISFYFLLFNAKARSASRDFLNRALGRKAGLREIYRHIHHFANVILDRLYLLTGRHDYFDIEIEGMDILQAQLDKGGCILLGSHLGSFEVLRALAVRELDIPVKVMMYENNAGKINAVLDALNPEVADSVIPIGKTFSLLQVGETLEKGGMVGILGDRLSFDDKTVSVDFMGEPTRFPGGPLLLTSILHAPVVLFYGIYLGNRRYRICFELLSEEITVDRRNRLQSLQPWVQRYADSLEAMARRYPYNWFNFYDYWSNAE